VKDSVEVQSPGSDFFLVVLRVKVLRNHISFALLYDLLLDFRHSPEVRSKTSSIEHSKGALQA